MRFHEKTISSSCGKQEARRLHDHSLHQEVQQRAKMQWQPVQLAW